MIRFVKSIIRNCIDRFVEMKITVKEFFSNGKKKKYDKIYMERKILLSAHSIEKSMGLRGFEPGHSTKEINYLLKLLEAFYIKNYDCNCFAFKEGLAAVREYLACQVSFDVNYEGLRRLDASYKNIIKRIPKEIYSASLGYSCGVSILHKKDLQNNATNFELFVAQRHSVRMFSKEIIPYSLIERAVELANYAPSACNRQPNRVYFCNSKMHTKLIGELIAGNKGFEDEINNFILLTSSRGMFSGDEQFQWFINGGIYLESLILSLHSLQIASCIMQWKAFNKSEKKIKKICGIAGNEAIIAIIGVGFYEDNTKVIAAQRMSASDNLKIIE